MVNAPIIVREVDINDLKNVPAATIVVNDAYRSEGGWTTEKDIISGLRCTEEDMVQFITENGKPNTLLFAFKNNFVAGTIKINPSHESPNEAEVGLFSVSPLHQSRGIGRKLICQAMSEMTKLGFDTAVIQVLENRPEIISWYRKLGFEKTGERIPFGWPEKLKVLEDIHVLILKKTLLN